MVGKLWELGIVPYNSQSLEMGWELVSARGHVDVMEVDQEVWVWCVLGNVNLRLLSADGTGVVS